MATWRQALEVAMTDEDVARLMAISRSRTEPASRVERAQMLLAPCPTLLAFRLPCWAVGATGAGAELPAVRSSRMQLADGRQLSARPRASPFLSQKTKSRSTRVGIFFSLFLGLALNRHLTTLDFLTSQIDIECLNLLHSHRFLDDAAAKIGAKHDRMEARCCWRCLQGKKLIK